MIGLRRTLVWFAWLALCASQLTCKVDSYCLDCVKADGKGPGDGGPDDGSVIDAIDATDAGCVPTGSEICDGKDNDCNGIVDDGLLPGVGDTCANQTGECAGAVHQCVAGVLTCTRNPAPEVCDGKDNDCNGLTDEGDPGGGGVCGSGVGECTTGVKHCVAGTVQCFGAVGPTAEVCDAKDNDCNGLFDDGLTNLGPCGVSNVGACKFGTMMCTNGSMVCGGAVNPVFETCNGKDDDCDNVIDNGYDTTSDPQNCGMCGNVCGASLVNGGEANWGCSTGTCVVASCKAGYHDNNGLASDGCEFGVCFTTGVEVCDGVDNDCDGVIDEQLGTPPAICATQGECAGAVAQCAGAQGWKCTYGTTVSTDMNGNIVPETKCDGKDNDCNNVIDDHQPNLGLSCNDSGIGACQGTGVFQCDAANLDGPAVCVLTTPGATPVAETCNGKDDDCNGLVDDNAPDAMVDVSNTVAIAAAPTGATEVGTTATFTTTSAHRLGVGAVVTVTGVGVAGYNGTWVVTAIPSTTTYTATLATSALAGSGGGSETTLFHIYTYEASRPDASAAGGGTMSARSCSRAGVLPWSSVTETQAASACAAAGKRLCTAAEWQLACEGSAANVYPYGNTYKSDSCNGNDYDPNCTAPDDDLLLPTGTSYGCPTKPTTSACVSTYGAYDMSGNLKEWTSTQVQPGAFNVRGGAFDTASGGLACRFNFVSMDSTFSYANLGFRCCSAP